MYLRINFKNNPLKKLLVTIIILCGILNINAQENEATTYYLIRHAEKIRKDKSNKNPELTKQGHSRAENWSVVFENVDFDLIYSTKYHRTIQTAEPTAKKENLEIQFYNPSKLFDADFKTKTKGKTVLVVGHSNTTPQFVNDILGKHVYENIDDSNNDNLYIVTVTGNNKNNVLIRIPHTK